MSYNMYTLNTDLASDIPSTFKLMHIKFFHINIIYIQLLPMLFIFVFIFLSLLLFHLVFLNHQIYSSKNGGHSFKSINCCEMCFL